MARSPNQLLGRDIQSIPAFQRMDPPSDSYQDCLCLLCRKTGHIVENCPQYTGWESPDSTVSSDVESTLSPDADTPPYPPFSPFRILEESTQALCQQCSQMEASSKIESHVPIVLENLDFNKQSRRAAKETTRIPSLGPVRSLRLLSTCPLCRLIFNVSDLGDEEMGDIYGGHGLVLVTRWSIHRLEPNLYWKGCKRGVGQYAKCVYTSVTTEWSGAGIYKPQRLVEEVVEALGLIDIGEGPSNGAPALGIRQVDPKTPDYSIIKDWLRRCNDLHHITCRPLVSEGLERIKLIDVETRKVVMYPSDGCDYIALSYVWGGVEQPGHKLGEVLPDVPATLEDAMVVTHKLGKKYLWVDSLCIDQEDSMEKAIHIAVMGAIYSGAWATIICLSGRSAQSGLPRVGTLQGVVPQLSCEIWGKRLLSVMPTLDQQVSWSPWATRAWTYQEGLLSPRRLFFTDHQVYFECNSGQCCESLDDSNSPFHLASDEERQVALNDAVQDEAKFGIAGPESVIGWGVLRNPFRPISNAAEAQIDVDNFPRYLRFVHSYTMKEVSHDADSLNAFSAVLTRLEEKYYKSGFVQGLPVDDLPKALLWYHLDRPRRRIGFPAWSWAGWEGGVSNIMVQGAGDPHNAVMPPLRIWKAGNDGHPELVYGFNPTPDIIKELEEPPGEESESQDSADDGRYTDSSGGDEDPDLSSGPESGSEVEALQDEDSFEEINFESGPVFRLAKMMLETPAALPRIDEDELLIEGITVQLSLAEPPDACSDSLEGDGSEYELCFIQVEGQPEPQRLRLYGYSEKFTNQESYDQEFLLLSRELPEDDGPGIYNALLHIDRVGDVANRVGVASLKLDNAELLDSCKPERRLFKLRP